jgi:chromosome segregation protein
MYLKRLEIQGFKSFANKTVLEFEKGTTAVVGPNGSGKSNIADSIRWVLGEQSTKQLRGKKSEDVIFAGSEKKSRLSFAEVSVTFDNLDRRIPLDYAEVAITRRIDRSGESDYLINGNKVRLLDVIDLILKSNIGTSRYTVIGQGTIDQMILSGPGEIKNLLDEASGVKTYYLRREKTLKRLETTTQNLIRVQDMINEIEPRLKSLKRQAKRMEERENVESQMRLLQVQFYAKKYKQLNSGVTSLVANLGAYTLEREKLEHEVNSLRSALDSNENSNRTEISEYQEIQGSIRKLQDRKNKLLEDAAMIRGKINANTVAAGSAAELQIEQSRLQAEEAQLKQKISESSSAALAISEKYNNSKKTLDEISIKLQDLQKTLEHPRDLTFTRFSEELEDTDKVFQSFYADLHPGSPVDQIFASASRLNDKWHQFKERATRFVRDPFEEFDKQREAMQIILSEKDIASNELNKLDLEKSKHELDNAHYEQELSKIARRLLQVTMDLSQANNSDPDAFIKELTTNEQRLSAEILEVSAQASALEEKISVYHDGEQSRKQQLLETERRQRLLQDEMSRLRDKESQVQVQKAVLDTQINALLDEAKHNIGEDKVNEFTDVSFVLVSEEDLQQNVLEQKIAKLKSQLDLIGGIDELTIKEYHETETRYTYLVAQIEDLQKGIADLRAVIDELDTHIKKRFQTAFTQIDEKFQSYFRILFNGGRAYLSLIKAKESQTEAESVEEKAEDEQERKEENSSLRPEEKILQKYEQESDLVIGIDIKATPPGKKLATISALSGGERALTSIALLCALLTCFPSPFVVLDEVDAALDEANTARFAHILGTISSGTQFVTVTHNRETMRQANILYGVTMGDDSVSKVLSLKMEQAQAYAK